MILAVPLLIAAVAADPRPTILELARAGPAGPALAAVERELAERPARSRELGLDFLRGELAARAGRPAEAIEAYTAALGVPALAPWARLRLARAESAAGHPERAAELAAALLASQPPAALVRPALEQLRRALSLGGDCSLLASLERVRWRTEERRLFELTRAECLAWQGRAEEARRRARALLEQDPEDAVAHEAAQLVGGWVAGEPDRETARWLGLAAYAHREFELAIPHLARAIDPRAAWDRQRWELEFALARSDFWLGHHLEAARRFQRLAARPAVAERRAAALYQAGRCLELAGETSGALAAFLAAQQAEPDGEWSMAAESSALRIELLADEVAAARERLARLSRRRHGQSALARSALFLAAGQVARGRSEGVRESLDFAQTTRAVAPEAVHFWRGRSAELAGDLEAASREYFDALERGPHHPFARAALWRLERPELAPFGAMRARVAAAAGEPPELWRAARLLGETSAAGAEATRRGLARLRERPATALWIDWQPVPVTAWPLWRAAPTSPEEILLGLGFFEEAPMARRRHFPSSRPDLAFTAAAQLAERGAHRRSLALAEALFEQRPTSLPVAWVSRGLRRLLYPLPHETALRTEAERHRIDPLLLAALIREESRFDAQAVSAASARGLTQFVLPTARRVGAALGWPRLEARDLLRPETSIALGAAYLGELAVRFRGREEVMLAAYNAGEAQAELWLRYCFTQEPEEFLSKIGFRETRAYVLRVLESYAHYRELDASEAS